MRRCEARHHRYAIGYGLMRRMVITATVPTVSAKAKATKAMSLFNDHASALGAAAAVCLGVMWVKRQRLKLLRT
jgi:hypothetical protein